MNGSPVHSLVRRTPLDGSLVLLLLGGLLGYIVSYDRSLSGCALVTLFVGIAIYYATAWLGNRRAFGRRLSVGLVSAGGSVATYFVLQAGHLDYPVKSELIGRISQALGRIVPRFAVWRPHPNHVASFLAGLLPLSVALVWEERRPTARVLFVAVALAMAVGLLMTASRGAILALVTTAGLAAALRWRWVGLLGAAVGVFLVAAGAIVLLVDRSALEDMPVIGAVFSSLAARLDRLTVWRGSLYLIQDYVFTGIGLGKVFPLIYSRYVLLIQHEFVPYSHHLWIEAWLQQGILGFLGLAWLVGAFYPAVLRTLQRLVTLPAWFHGAWLGVTSVLLHGLADSSQYVTAWCAITAFALLGLALSIVPTRKQARAALRRRRATAALVGLFAVILAAGVFWRPLASLGLANRGALRHTRADLSPALSDGERLQLIASAKSDYERAVRLLPDNRSAHQRLGLLEMDAGHYDQAVVWLEGALRIDPKNTSTHKALGLAYVWVARLDEAEQLLAKVPQIVEELNVWGGWRREQGEIALARYAYTVSLRLAPGQEHIRDALDNL